MIVGMTATGFFSCGRGDRLNKMANGIPGSAEPIAVVGDTTITQRVMDAELEQANNGPYGNIDQFPPELQLTFKANTVKGVVGYALMLEVAKKYGVKISDDEIVKQMEAASNDEVMRLKAQLIQQKQLQENATQAEFEKVFEKLTGKSLDQAKKDVLDSQKVKLEEPDTRVPLEALSLSQPLLEAIKKTITVTDEQVKKSYDKFVCKVITITKGDVDSVAKKAEADIKGGLSFEAAIDRYSNAQAADPKKKKLHDETVDISRTTVETTIPQFVGMNALAKLKPGEVSEPIKTASGVAIYKLLEIKSELPKDFEKNKEENKETYLTTLASQKLQTDLAEVEKNTKIDWKEPVYKAMYEYAQLGAGPATVNKERASKLLDILTEVQDASQNGAANSSRLASQVAYALYLELQNVATPDQKKKVDEMKPDILANYLRENENASLRMVLVETYFGKKDAQNFFDQLYAAANANLASTDTTAQGIYNEINKYAKKGEDAKLLTADEVKQIEDVQRMWVENKAQQDKDDAEMKRQEEELKKQEAEEAKKNAPAAKSREDFDKEKTGAGSSKPKGK